jgi:hypothetical protein
MAVCPLEILAQNIVERLLCLPLAKGCGKDIRALFGPCGMAGQVGTV